MPRLNIVNLVNFIRAIEPRAGRELDLPGTVERQMELSKKRKLPTTWLLQYDALIDKRFMDLMKRVGPEDEIGVWLEFVQPLVEKAGGKWRGRFPWDWHANAGFSIGFPVEERKRMVDVFIADFKAAFGFAPKAAGSWFADAHTLAHLAERHGIEAFCDCKDQWGTDGYTLWGGYFNQAYYPSRLNSYIPAQTQAAQIPLPVFRMLGSDPIHQYEAACEGNGQSVITLEPVYKKGGGDPRWTDWFFDAIFKEPCLSFGYAQAGQENSFGWPAMEKGLTYQCERLEKLRDAGLIVVETLSASGRRFSSKYGRTPPSATVASRDLDDPSRGAFYYCSKRYRASAEWKGANLRLRDMQLFDERREEPYLNSVCDSSACKYDALPFLDGFLWSSKAVKAGLRLRGADGAELQFQGAPSISEDGETRLLAKFGDFLFVFEEESFGLRGPAATSWSLTAAWSPEAKSSFRGVGGGRALFEHEGFAYSFALAKGSMRALENGYELKPDAGGELRLAFHLD